MADILSRQFNKIFINNDPKKISDLFANLQPPLSKKHVGVTLNPQMLTDLLSGSPQAEYLDCFAKRDYYEQSLSRYHSSPKNILTLNDEPQPTELCFLAEVYSGFNKSTISTQQFQELSNQLNSRTLI